jgi:hypothetical protein
MHIKDELGAAAPALPLKNAASRLLALTPFYARLLPHRCPSPLPRRARAATVAPRSSGADPTQKADGRQAMQLWSAIFSAILVLILLTGCLTRNPNRFPVEAEIMDISEDMVRVRWTDSILGYTPPSAVEAASSRACAAYGRIPVLINKRCIRSDSSLGCVHWENLYACQRHAE